MRPAAAVPTPAPTGWAGLPPAWQRCWREAVAARDPWAGSTNLLGTTPYLALKPIRLQWADLPVLAAVVSVIHTVWRKRLYPRASGDPVIDRWLTAQPGPTQRSLQLWRDGWAAEHQATAGEQAAALYDELAVLCAPLLDKDMA